MDQANIYTQIDQNLSPYTLTSPATLAAVANVIPIYLCPSTPRQSNKTTYSIPNNTVLASGYPGTNRQYDFTGGACDYLMPSGVRGDFSNLAYTSIGGSAGNRHAVTNWNITFTPVGAPGVPPASGGADGKIGSIVDGTSNTMLIVENAARNVLYRKGKPVVPADVESTTTLITGGGAWADSIFAGDIWINGTGFNGVLGTDGGPCAINCSNASHAGLFSFHAGGAHTLLADGTVRLLNENIAAFTLASLITREKGELLGDF